MALSGLKTQTEFLPSIRFNAREGIFSTGGPQPRRRG